MKVAFKPMKASTLPWTRRGKGYSLSMATRPFLVNIEVARQSDGTPSVAQLAAAVRKHGLDVRPAFPTESTGPFALEFYVEVEEQFVAEKLASELSTLSEVVSAYVKPPARLAAHSRT